MTPPIVPHGPQPLDPDEAFVVLVAFLLVLSVIGGVGIHLVYQAPVILAEAAFQVVLAAALEKSSRRAGGIGWSGSVFRATWPAFGLVLSLVAVFGWVAQRYCPAATRLLDVFFFGCLLAPWGAAGQAPSARVRYSPGHVPAAPQLASARSPRQEAEMRFGVCVMANIDERWCPA